MLAACLSAHRTMINGSALCTAAMMHRAAVPQSGATSPGRSYRQGPESSRAWFGRVGSRGFVGLRLVLRRYPALMTPTDGLNKGINAAVAEFIAYRDLHRCDPTAVHKGG